MAVANSTNAPLDVVVRFSTSNPDLILPIRNPSTTSALTLKQQIRAQLSTPQSESRLRLIHAGRVISDDNALGKSLHARVPPPPRAGEDSKSEKAKGKQPLKDHVEALRVYVHCSIGDALVPSELAAEAKAAADADDVLASAIQSDTNAPSNREHAPASTTTPAPRGFDRLLTAGFTAAEVATLRTQFMAIQSHTHTPDTMPTGHDLLVLEEQWLDNGSNAATAGGEAAGGFGGDDSRGLDDLIWGNLMGFFWPVGAMFWLMREEGVWSGRRQTAVLAGFIMNLTFGFFRLLS
ncbi:hypothetical protein Q7P37_003662 [Cladosporium fusiforme]